MFKKKEKKNVIGEIGGRVKIKKFNYDEHRCKNPQQNTSKPNSTIH